MKYKLLCLLLVASLLFAVGCNAKTPVQTEPLEQTESQPFSDDTEIAAIWVNAGQYSDGKDFVETMTLFAGGTVTIHMDYQGKSYETLTGTYTARQGVLTVTIQAYEPYQRIYQYELDGNILTLYGNEKTVTYRRSD